MSDIAIWALGIFCVVVVILLVNFKNDLKAAWKRRKSR